MNSCDHPRDGDGLVADVVDLPLHDIPEPIGRGRFEKFFPLLRVRVFSGTTVKVDSERTLLLGGEGYRGAAESTQTAPVWVDDSLHEGGGYQSVRGIAAMLHNSCALKGSFCLGGGDDSLRLLLLGGAGSGHAQEL